MKIFLTDSSGDLGKALISQIQKNEFIISTDKTKLNHQLIHNYLTNSYWAKGRSLEQVSQSIDHSLCFGVYHSLEKIGFARVITDYTSFAYLADVFILPSYQKKGLGQWLIETIFSIAELQSVITWLLLTKDAHKLYEKVGFQRFNHADRVMIKK